MITNSGGITNGITDAIDASATEIVNALNFGTNTILGTTGDINLDNFDVTGSNGNIVTAGTLAVNGDSITADGATLTVNAGGNVDVQDTLNADSLTSDAGVSIAAGNSYTGAGAVTLSSGGAAALTLDSASGSVLLNTDDDLIPTLGAGNADIGATGTRWDNIYTVAANLTGNLTIADDMWIGLGASDARFTFDTTASPSTITVNDANLALGANSLTGTTGNIDMDNFDVTGSTGNIVTAGTLAVNGDSITADGATLTVNAGGNVDVQDALNADNITTDTGGVSIAANQSYTGAGAVTLDSGTTTALNIGTGANAKDITIGNTEAATNIILTKGASGNITFTGYNCSTLTNGGTLTTDASGNVICANDDGGAGVSWSSLTAPSADLVLNMGNWDTTMNWTNTGAIDAWLMALNNNAGSATTQNLMTLQNAVSTQTTDVNTETLLKLDNADTSAAGSTIVDDAILITNSGGITDGITDAIDASATEIVQRT